MTLNDYIKLSDQQLRDLLIHTAREANTAPPSSRVAISIAIFNCIGEMQGRCIQDTALTQDGGVFSDIVSVLADLDNKAFSEWSFDSTKAIAAALKDIEGPTEPPTLPQTKNPFKQFKPS